MEFAVTDFEQGKRIALSGQFTFADNHKFRKIMEITQEANIKSIELNFSEVDFIDSAGLGMLLLFRDECQNLRIALSIHAVRGQVEKIFMISKFDQLFTMHTPE